MKRKIKILFENVRVSKEMGNIEEAIAYLHQIIEEDETNVMAYYLIANFYFELQNTETSIEYCDRALTIDPLYKEALELKAIIYEKQNEDLKAEEYYLKALEVDANFHNARNKLIHLYFYKIKNYEKTNIHCNYMLKNRDVERNEYKKKEKIKVAEHWFLLTTNIYASSLIKSKQYLEAINVIKEVVSFSRTYVDYFPGFFHAEEEQIYKLYYLMKDEKGMEESRNILIDECGFPEEELLDFEKEAEEGQLRTL